MVYYICKVCYNHYPWYRLEEVGLVPSPIKYSTAPNAQTIAELLATHKRIMGPMMTRKSAQSQRMDKTAPKSRCSHSNLRTTDAMLATVSIAPPQAHFLSYYSKMTPERDTPEWDLSYRSLQEV
jgi:hypothetical protein